MTVGEVREILEGFPDDLELAVMPNARLIVYDKNGNIILSTPLSPMRHEPLGEG